MDDLGFQGLFEIVKVWFTRHDIFYKTCKQFN